MAKVLTYFVSTTGRVHVGIPGVVVALFDLLELLVRRNVDCEGVKELRYQTFCNFFFLFTLFKKVYHLLVAIAFSCIERL